MTVQKSRGTCEVGAEIFAAYLHQPRTRREVTEVVGVDRATEGRWFHQMRQSGVLRCIGYRPASRGARAAVYELQAPFANPDDPTRPPLE